MHRRGVHRRNSGRSPSWSALVVLWALGGATAWACQSELLGLIAHAPMSWGAGGLVGGACAAIGPVGHRTALARMGPRRRRRVLVGAWLAVALWPVLVPVVALMAILGALVLGGGALGGRGQHRGPG